MAGFGSEEIAAGVQPAHASEQARVAGVIREMARPRLTGSEGAAETDRYLKGELEGLGYEVRELPFRFSALPGRWGLPGAGLVVLLCGVGSAALAARHEGEAALALYGMGALLLALGATFARAAIRRLPLARMEGANWLVARPNARPRFLVAAHRDSKSQAVPLFVRAAAIGLGLAAALALLLLDLVSYLAPLRWHLGVAATLIGLACAAVGMVLMLTVVGNRSPGALDNASGVAALVGLAAREQASDDVAFLLTDAEELGLAGAMAAARQLPPVFGIINVDGLDDTGDFYVIERHGLPRRGMAPHLVAALLAGAGAVGVRAQRHALPLGVLLDHVPLVEGGFPAVTLMRGSRESLRRVHLPQDDASHLTGAGAAEAVALLAAALAVLRADAPGA